MIRGASLRRMAIMAGAVLAVLAMPAAPALADARLQTRLYDPEEVVTIRGRVRVAATIKFGEDESIENVVIGDSGAWQITPNKRATLLFVKPLKPSAATNMTVVTNKHTYLFDLIASPRHKPLYVLQFTYPEPEIDPEEEARLAAAENPPETANPIEMQAASDPYAVADPATLNFDWTAEGDSALLPTQTYDNGKAVFLVWPQGRAVPAILTRNEAGEEGPVNFTVRGETVIVQDVPRELILRTGDDSAVLTNTAPDRSARLDRNFVPTRAMEAL